MPCPTWPSQNDSVLPVVGSGNAALGQEIAHLAQEACSCAPRKKKPRKPRELLSNSNWLCHGFYDNHSQPATKKRVSALDSGFIATSSYAKGIMNLNVPFVPKTTRLRMEPFLRLRFRHWRVA
jgi:hypothetical protein